MTAPNAARCTYVADDDQSIQRVHIEPRLAGWYLVTDLVAPESERILGVAPVIGGWEVSTDAGVRYFGPTTRVIVSRGPVSPAFRSDGTDTGALDLRS